MLPFESTPYIRQKMRKQKVNLVKHAIVGVLKKRRLTTIVCVPWRQVYVRAFKTSIKYSL